MIDRKQPGAFADHLLTEGRERSRRRTRRFASVVFAIQRIYTGSVTLVGAGIGFYISQRMLAGSVEQVAASVACGLLAAVVWPRTRF